MKDQDLPGLAMTRSLGDSFAAIAGVSSIPGNFKKKLSLLNL